jgi:branched-chain amino acid aminotransferase
MSFDHTKWAWMSGRMVAWQEASVPLSTHALHYGSGVFEGVRCYQTEDGPAIFRLQDHVERLFRSAQAYGIEVPFTPDTMMEACREVVRRNGFTSCYLRPIVYLGSDNLGIRGRCPVEAAVLAWPWANQLGQDGLRSGVRVTVSPWVKFHQRMMPTTAKGCGQYMNSRLAVQDAMRRGFDEALLLDADGRIAEGAVENVFLVRDGRVVTNDERSSILLGITRDSVIQIARDLGYPVQIDFLRLEDLLLADEAFFTGTATEVTPIREVDGAPIGTGTPGPITARLQSVFFAATEGREARYRGWLDVVGEPASKAAMVTSARG